MSRRAVFNADLPDAGYLAGLYHDERLRRGLGHFRSEAWASDARLHALGAPQFSFVSHSTEDRVVQTVGDGIAWVTRESGGMVHCRACGTSPGAAAAGAAWVRERLPEAEAKDDTVPVYFWSYGSHGPRSIRRELDAPAWSELGLNYAAATSAGLAPLFEDGFRPGTGGQLVLWSGEPGTGKTTCLRALAREWRGWCDAHYIADPDQFFGAHADYMLDVMLETVIDSDGDEGGERWRLLILEDTGELLKADARRDVGQALSRFLNATDGLIGQGLRVLVLVTTNEDIGKLHPAVVRSGRGAARVEFEPLSVSEARDWRAAHELPGPPGSRAILADLYAELQGHRVGGEEKAPVGFAA